MSEVTLHHGDCLQVLKTLPSDSVDAICTDPPYGLRFMGKRWDYDVPKVEVWEQCLRVLKPGGHLLAFAGTRTQHRMAVRIEDAGFEIRDMIAWVYGSGFPKSLDVSKAIDKAAGAERASRFGTENDDRGSMSGAMNSRCGQCNKQFFSSNPCTCPRQDKVAVTEAARQWQGWGTALKPAFEPITVARKPFPGTVVSNVLTHGTGALNIDGCRVGWPDGKVPEIGTPGWGGPAKKLTAVPGQEGATVERSEPNTAGRWPANLIHDGSEEVLECFPDDAGAQAPVHRRNGDKFRHSYGAFAGNIDEQGSTFHADGLGNAARFFYCAKASREDRNDGVEHLPPRPLLWSSGEQNPGSFQSEGTDKSSPNNHPTVKPTDLMRWMCRLVTPKGGIVLDPYMGSGSTGRGAVLEGFNFIGIDEDAWWVEIARLRIKRAGMQPSLF
jgi:DNA modification methylase